MSSKNITLMTSDNEKFEVEEEIAKRSLLLKNMIEDGCTEDVIPLPIVDANTFEKIITYCKKHVEVVPIVPEGDFIDDNVIADWDDKFVKDLTFPVLFELLNASHYLNIPGLMSLCCRKVADEIQQKSLEEIRVFFNIKNDFTPAEEAKLKKLYKWALD